MYVSVSQSAALVSQLQSLTLPDAEKENETVRLTERVKQRQRKSDRCRGRIKKQKRNTNLVNVRLGILALESDRKFIAVNSECPSCLVVTFVLSDRGVYDNFAR